MRRLIIGDVHGNRDALLSALDQAKYEPATDRLFFVGDYIDRQPYSKEVVDLILELPDKICIRGNHDQFMIDFLHRGDDQESISTVWADNGGRSTLESYGFKMRKSKILSPGTIPREHVNFYNALIPYHVTPDNNAVLHGGFDLNLRDMSANYIIWDRLMWKTAIEEHARGQATFPCFNRFQKIFIGHTNLLIFPGQQECLPQKRLNVWNIDTGAGFTGPLTIMDMDTEKFWQSE